MSEAQLVAPAGTAVAASDPRYDAAASTPLAAEWRRRASWVGDEVRARLYGSGTSRTRSIAAPRIGVELELLAHDEAGTPLPLDSAPDDASTPSGTALLRHAARRAAWAEGVSPGGLRHWCTPDGGRLSFEPGGQIEYSGPPTRSLARLIARVADVRAALEHAAAALGVTLAYAGLEPRTPLDAQPLQLRASRYVRMDRYLATRGRAGGRMMRQTAALQVNVDIGDDGARRWRVLNAAAPVLTAMFANSPLVEGREAHCASARALCWRELDDTRTGAFAGDGSLDEVAERYTEFALRAPWILAGDAGGGSRGDAPGDAHGDAPGTYRPAAAWLADGGMDASEWRVHLSTLFPEVRPKGGYLELRALDTLPPRWHAVPLVLVAGLLYDRSALADADQLLPPPTPERLRRAAVSGVHDAELGALAVALGGLALDGARRLADHGATIADAPAAIADAADFLACYTALGRAPADDVVGGATRGDAILSALAVRG